MLRGVRGALINMNILKGHYKQVFFSVIAAVIGVFFSIIPFFAVSKIVTLIIEKKINFEYFTPLLGVVVIGLLGKNIFHQISTLTSHNLAFGIIANVRIKVANKLERLSMGEIEKKSSGKWVTFMDEGIHKMELPIAHVIPEVISNLLVSLFLIIIVLIVNYKIGIANLLTLPLAMIFMKLTMKGYKEKYSERLEKQKQMSTVVVDYIKGIKVIKAFNKSATSYARYKEVVEEYKGSQVKWYLGSALYATLMIEILPSTLLFVLPVSMYVYIRGEITVGNMIMCVLLAYATYTPLLKVMAHFDNTATIKYVLDDINSVLNVPELKRGEYT